jgi:hypothetical protein
MYAMHAIRRNFDTDLRVAGALRLDVFASVRLPVAVVGYGKSRTKMMAQKRHLGAV